MGKATLKGLLAHKFRLAATALAIVLGVSFVAGTYVLTDTINATFTNLFDEVTQGIDVAVRSEDVFSGQMGEVRDPIPEEVLNEVKAVDGVKVAEGSVTGFAQFVDKDGKPVTTGGAPTLGVSISSAPELQAGTTVRSGRLPSGPNEMVVDAQTADKHGFAVGDRVKVLLQGPARTFTVSGIIGFGSAGNLGGATLAGFTLPTAQEVLNREGRFDEIDVVAAEGTTPEQLRDRVRAVLDPRYEVLTGEELSADAARAINDTFGRFLSTALLSFAFVALLVGAFLIFNTFTIIVAQRTRELALLRCLGASRRQVMTSVLLESLIVAVVASLVGLGLGVLIANGLKALLTGILNFDLPTTGTVFLWRTVIVSLAVGIVVTLLAALLPARKATRVPPVAALQPETAFAPTHFRKRRIVLGVLVTLVGIALLLAGLFQNEGNRLVNVASGAVIVFFGVAILSPLIARPLARLIGWPFARAFRLPGTLARENAMRNPRRTASTAAALMIGLALVTFVSIFAASIKASTTETLDRTIAADYILMNDTFTPFSPDLAATLADQPELAAVVGVRLGAFKFDGATKQLIGIDPAAYDRVVKTEVLSGSIADLQSGGLAVKEDVAEANGWTVGERVALQFPRGGTQQVTVKAIYKDNSVNGDYLLSLADYERFYADQADSQILVQAAPGTAPDASRAA
ncbi:MAG TPA: ABC transporter permease, partial [Actinomycetota bacterium]|nr:ABC transporter permease [Actinomycetota bacterium]